MVIDSPGGDLPLLTDQLKSSLLLVCDDLRVFGVSNTWTPASGRFERRVREEFEGGSNGFAASKLAR